MMNAARTKARRRPGPYRYRYKRLHPLHLDVVAVVLCLSGWFLFPSFEEAEYVSSTLELDGMIAVSSPGVDYEALVFAPEIFAFGGNDALSEIREAAEHGFAADGAEPLLPPTPEDEWNEAMFYVPDSSPVWPGYSIIGRIEMPPAPYARLERGAVVDIPATTNPVERVARGILRVTGKVRESPAFEPGYLKSALGKSVGVVVVFDRNGHAEAAVLEPNSLLPEDAAAVERAAMRLNGEPDTSAHIVYTVPEGQKSY